MEMCRSERGKLTIKSWELKGEGHRNQRNDLQPKKLLIIRQIFLISMLGIVPRTVGRMCILMLGCQGLRGKIVITC